jgi:mono/diheme cytochrome c family protein
LKLTPGGLLPLLIAAGGCQLLDRGPRVAEELSPRNFFLEQEYPAEFPTPEVTLSRAFIARGDSLYKGATGSANCVFCHGPLLIGGSQRTNLIDNRWWNGDGSYASIIAIINAGVARPGELYMPPMGGVSLSPEEIRAIAAYVYWAANTKPSPHDMPAD